MEFVVYSQRILIYIFLPSFPLSSLLPFFTLFNSSFLHSLHSLQLYTLTGITYDSECHLLRSKCLSSYDSLASSNLTIVHQGPCEDFDEEEDTDGTEDGKVTSDGIKRKKSSLCSKAQCPFFGICKELIPGITSCHCPECRADQRPVCGSDGTTYQNECFVRKTSCETSNTIEVLHEGHCDPFSASGQSNGQSNGQVSNGQMNTGSSPCQSIKCGPFATCEVNMYGEGECICPSVCLRIDSPVCGSDGKTYENECELRIQSCKIQTLIAIMHKGQCGEYLMIAIRLINPHTHLDCFPVVWFDCFPVVWFDCFPVVWFNCCYFECLRCKCPLTFIGWR